PRDRLPDRRAGPETAADRRRPGRRARCRARTRHAAPVRRAPARSPAAAPDAPRAEAHRRDGAERAPPPRRRRPPTPHLRPPAPTPAASPPASSTQHPPPAQQGARPAQGQPPADLFSQLLALVGDGAALDTAGDTVPLTEAAADADGKDAKTDT